MGHRKLNAPRRGSLAYLPRGRAKKQGGRIRYWPTFEGSPALLGFAGYKAGMTHIYTVDDRRFSPDHGREVFQPVTVVDAPPMVVCALRAYQLTPNGLKSFTEVWAKPPKDLERLFTVPERFDASKPLRIIEDNLEKIAELRVVLCTQPRLASVPKKKPDMMEVKVGGGSLKQQFEFVKPLLGKSVSASNVFKEGQYVDLIAVTKGKGIQGPVKRFGVKILSHKSRKTKRGVGSLGPWHPARVLYTVPRSGQMGYSQRTEYNKRIMKIGSDGSDVTPKGGFIRYGQVKGDYVMVTGSVLGPAKRLIKLRHPAKPPSLVPEAPPQILSISVESPQGK